MARASETDYRARFKSCGENVVIDPDVRITGPESLEVGDEVHFMRGLHLHDAVRACRIGSHVRFWPWFFCQGGGELIVGSHVDLYPRQYLSLGGPDGFIHIGDHAHLAPGCALYGHGGLTIGPWCAIAAHVVLATVGHDASVTDRPMASAPGKSAPITLEEDVWIAANATVSAGVTVARGCVIGANAVVTRDTQPGGFYAGVPARRVRDR